MEKRRKASITQVEESELHAPLCLNNCAFPGSPATDSACSPGSAPSSIWSPGPTTPADEKGGEGMVEVAAIAASPASREVNRCLLCRKRLGLTGFCCRCGDLFCGEHRYSDRHECGFDYKAAARTAIARANPVVRAAKIARI